MSYKIESDIPIPSRSNSSKRYQGDNCPFPFKRMQPGDSFVIKNASKKATPSLIHYWSKRKSVTTTYRQIGKNKIRVWLVSQTRAAAAATTTPRETESETVDRQQAPYWV